MGNVLKILPSFITEAIKCGENPLAVAQYCGTSLAMIQGDCCGTLGLRLDHDRTKIEPQAENSLQKWLRGRDLNPGPQGYEPCELPDCSTPRQHVELFFYLALWLESR